MKSSEEIVEIRNRINGLVNSNQDQSILAEIYSILLNAADKQVDWFDRLDEDDKASIQRGIDDFEAGRVISQRELIEESKTWTVK